eukprot:COSAG01_NODE_70165_length_259_cov_0.800000_1_plen_32_part_01
MRPPVLHPLLVTSNGLIHAFFNTRAGTHFLRI